ncbi:MAG: hypothetical protein GC168_15420 [Candidatus Hydrogenedens sp.]|nr:hypothetical protein [Candidatus Hydrogenedens sp.]
MLNLSRRVFLAAGLVLLSAHAWAESPEPKQNGVINVCDFFDNIEFLSFLGDLEAIDFIDINGDFTVRAGAVIPTGNGVPDAANELGLLERILNDPNFDNGVLNHQQVKDAWDKNLEQMRTRQFGRLLSGLLDNAVPGLVELLTAYVTLGDGFYNPENALRGEGTGSFGLVAAIFAQVEQVLRALPGVPAQILLADGTLDPQDFTLLTDLVAIDTADADGDGLSNFDEFEVFGGETCATKGNSIAYALAALSPDVDGDGMSDAYEARFAAVDGAPGLLPAVPDGDGNLDEDLLTNLEEYLRDSDPLDLDDPEITRFVSSSGSGQPFPDGGTRDNPWSINFGISQAPQNPAPGAKPTRLNLGPGVYEGDIEMTPGMIISSLTTAGAKGGDAVLLGRVTGAPRAKLQSITVEAPEDDAVLLTINNVAMDVVNVTFRGTAARLATGIRLNGLNAAETIIDGCDFESLATGIDVLDGVPKLRRSVFSNHAQRDTIIRSSTLTNDVGVGFGTSSSSDVGFNLFRDTQTLAIVNQRTQTLPAEQNEWDTENATIISSRVQGQADTSPFLLQGQAAFSGSLVVTVQDARTGTPINNASVNSNTGGGNIDPASPNVQPGNYVFAVLAAGPATVTVDAGDAYAKRIVPVILSSNAINTLFVAMAEPKAAPPQDGCCGQTNGKGASGADFGVAGLAMLLMAGAGRRRR